MTEEDEQEAREAAGNEGIATADEHNEHPDSLVEHRSTHEDTMTVEVTLGAKSQYRWTMKQHGNDSDKIVKDLSGLDDKLRERFG